MNSLHLIYTYALSHNVLYAALILFVSSLIIYILLPSCFSRSLLSSIFFNPHAFFGLSFYSSTLFTSKYFVKSLSGVFVESSLLFITLVLLIFMQIYFKRICIDSTLLRPVFSTLVTLSILFLSVVSLHFLASSSFLFDFPGRSTLYLGIARSSLRIILIFSCGTLLRFRRAYKSTFSLLLLCLIFDFMLNNSRASLFVLITYGLSGIILTSSLSSTFFLKTLRLRSVKYSQFIFSLLSLSTLSAFFAAYYIKLSHLFQNLGSSVISLITLRVLINNEARAASLEVNTFFTPFLDIISNYLRGLGSIIGLQEPDSVTAGHYLAQEFYSGDAGANTPLSSFLHFYTSGPDSVLVFFLALALNFLLFLPCYCLLRLLDCKSHSFWSIILIMISLVYLCQDQPYYLLYWPIWILLLLLINLLRFGVAQIKSFS